MPRLAPWIVIIPEPVPAWFLLSIELNEVTSTDHDSLILAKRWPTVKIMRRVPCVPNVTRQRTDDSDSQDVLSHPLCPNRLLLEKATMPNPIPCNVIDADAVLALLTRRAVLILGESTDHP